MVRLTNVLCAVAGAATMYAYNRYRGPVCCKCRDRVVKAPTLADKTQAPQQVKGYESISSKAHNAFISAMGAAASCIGLAKRGLSSISDVRNFNFDSVDPLTKELRNYVDMMFEKDTVLERFPVKPVVLSRDDIEFLTGEFGERVCLGSGSMGAVFVGRLKKTGQRVAIKVANDERCDIHFMVHEASLMTHLNDTKAAPYCHGLLALGSEDDLPMAAIVMDIVGEGTNVQPLDLEKYLLANMNDLNKKQLRAIFIQIADKLEKVHEKGVMINDIKEQNILVDGATHEPFLIDFGAGRFGIYEFPIPDAVRQNKEDYCHLAPELLRKYDPELEVSPWTDIYSYGKLISDMGKMLSNMVLMECGIFCMRGTPYKRLSLPKIREVLEKTEFSCTMENVVTV